MPTQKPYSRYDKRLVALLDRALHSPLIIRRKFRTYMAAYTFRQMLYQLRFAARRQGIKRKWDRLSFKITKTNDLVIGRRQNLELEDILEDLGVEEFIEDEEGVA